MSIAKLIDALLIRYAVDTSGVGRSLVLSYPLSSRSRDSEILRVSQYIYSSTIDTPTYLTSAIADSNKCNSSKLKRSIVQSRTDCMNKQLVHRHVQRESDTYHILPISISHCPLRIWIHTCSSDDSMGMQMHMQVITSANSNRSLKKNVPISCIQCIHSQSCEKQSY